MGEEQQPESTAGPAGGQDRDDVTDTAPSPEIADGATSEDSGEVSGEAAGEVSGEAAGEDAGERAQAGVFDELPDEVEYPVRPGEKNRLEGWRRRSAVGAMFTGLALGMREVLEPDRNEPAIVMETSGVPPKDLPVEADIDQVPPKQSVVRIRPWLLGDGTEDGEPSRPSDLGQASAGRPQSDEPVRPGPVAAPGAPRKR